MTKCYLIEDAVFSGRFARHMYDGDGVSPLDQRSWVDTITTVLDVPPIRFQRSRGGSGRAWPKDRRISIPYRGGRAYVAHEVAHVLSWDTDRDRGHGESWRWWYVECVRILLGDYHANRLRKAFDTEYEPTRKAA